MAPWQWISNLMGTDSSGELIVNAGAWAPGVMQGLALSCWPRSPGNSEKARGGEALLCAVKNQAVANFWKPWKGIGAGLQHTRAVVGRDGVIYVFMQLPLVLGSEEQCRLCIPSQFLQLFAPAFWVPLPRSPAYELWVSSTSLSSSPSLSLSFSLPFSVVPKGCHSPSPTAKHSWNAYSQGSGWWELL